MVIERSRWMTIWWELRRLECSGLWRMSLHEKAEARWYGFGDLGWIGWCLEANQMCKVIISTSQVNSGT